MDIDYYDSIYTLDWDKITISEANTRVNEILLDADTHSVVLRLSPTKGYHCIVETYMDVPTCVKRRRYRDDGLRLIHDIFNRPNHIHDILWSKKVFNGHTFEAYTIRKETK